MADEDNHKSKKCIDMHTFLPIEWSYGNYKNGRFVECLIEEATARRAMKIGCRHCTYIREIQYKD